MKQTKLFVLIPVLLAMTACGGGEKAASSTQNATDAALQNQVDVARATLQEKADALARQASMSPPDGKKK